MKSCSPVDRWQIWVPQWLLEVGLCKVTNWVSAEPSRGRAGPGLRGGWGWAALCRSIQSAGGGPGVHEDWAGPSVTQGTAGSKGLMPPQVLLSLTFHEEDARWSRWVLHMWGSTSLLMSPPVLFGGLLETLPILPSGETCSLVAGRVNKALLGTGGEGRGGEESRWPLCEVTNVPRPLPLLDFWQVFPFL